jgi:hypothetical protein
MKRYRRTAVVLLILACGAAAGLRYFLTSAFLARQVARHLRTRFGLAVSVEGIQVGLQGTTLFNVRLAGDENNLPLLRVDKLETDLTLWKLLCGQTRPQEITLQGAHLTLCFDQSGEWVVPVPSGPAAGSVIPRTHLHAGQLTVQREGWATLEISGIDAEITDAGQLVVSGSLHDSVWKGWTFHGTFAGTESSLSLQSDGDVPLSPTLLKSIPFVPAEIWAHVRYAGPTAVEVRLDQRPREAEWHYHVRLRPRRCSVEVPELDLVCSDVSGEVVVADGRVMLKDLKGRALRGMVRVAGLLDFSGEESTYRGRLEWQDVDLSAYLAEAPPAGANRGTADVRGKIAGVWGGSGEVVLQRCELIHRDGPEREGTSFRVFAAGKVNTEGRLDLSATARTSRAPPGSPLAHSLGDALTHLLVHVRVTGTVERPAYRIHPLPSLTAEARHFLLPRAGLE